MHRRALRSFLVLSIPVTLALGGVASAAQSGETAGSPDTPSSQSRNTAGGQDAAPRLWIALEGAWAQAFLTSADQQNSAGQLGLFIGTTIPVRLDVGIRLAERVWVAPFASAAWVKGEGNGLEEPGQPLTMARDGFRLLIGGEFQFHSARGDESLDIFGGTGLAFERLVAHSRFQSCGHCLPLEGSLIANGVNLGIRIGILAHVARFLQIGPYLGLQLSWMPGLKAQIFSYPFDDPSSGTINPGGSSEENVKDLIPWFEAGLRVVFLP